MDLSVISVARANIYGKVTTDMYSKAPVQQFWFQWLPLSAVTSDLKCVLKIDFTYLKDKRRWRDWETEFFIHWSTLPKVIMARTGSGHIREPRTPPRSPMWVTRTQVHGCPYHRCAPFSTFAISPSPLSPCCACQEVNEGTFCFHMYSRGQVLVQCMADTQ